MPNRILRDWTDSYPVNQLSASGERFFVRLIMKVDDFGLFVADPKLLRPTMYPLLLDQVREADIQRGLAECEEAGLIRCYAVENKQYLQLVKFKQRTRATEPKYPPPPPDDGQAPAKRPPDDRHTLTETETYSETDTDTFPPKPPKGGVATDFENWWDQYPHKVGKKAAQKAYTVARKVADHDTLMAGVAAYIRSKPADRAWCNPATWLNQGRWEDQPAGAGKAKPASAMSALTPEQERSLYEFTVKADPSIAGMPMGQDSVRRAMKKYLDAWRAV